jgi:hypothetical protein
MQGTFLIAQLHRWVVLDSFDYRRFQIINHYSLWHPTKIFKGMSVTPQPRFDLLVKHELHILMSAPLDPHLSETVEIARMLHALRRKVEGST